jgi:hypothetical protein|tara:strand:- start:1139 stop:1450 length:312 start_codon:yes stop_codon:yes gene_type:complete
MAFTKYFTRMITREELVDEDVIEYFDIVQSIVATKLLTAYDEEKEQVGIEVISYTDEDKDGNLFIYEIVLDEEINPEEGDEISSILFGEFDHITFSFEASIEI